jgi:hypothetical protein
MLVKVYYNSVTLHRVLVSGSSQNHSRYLLETGANSLSFFSKIKTILKMFVKQIDIANLTDTLAINSLRIRLNYHQSKYNQQ